MVEKEIPLMWYFIRITQLNNQVVRECIKGIRAQSNFEGYIILGQDMGVASPEWYVIVDDDVQLEADWIEKMWKYHDKADTISGRAFSHPNIIDYKKRTMKPRYLGANKRMIQCILSKEVNYLRKNKSWLEVPVVSRHCPSYVHNPYFQGKKDGIKYSKKRILRILLGGIKLSLKERHWIYAKNSILRAVGMLMG